MAAARSEVPIGGGAVGLVVLLEFLGDGNIFFDLGGDFALGVEVVDSHEVYELAAAGAFAGFDGFVDLTEVDVGLDGVLVNGESFADGALAFIFAGCPIAADFDGLDSEIVSINGKLPVTLLEINIPQSPIGSERINRESFRLEYF